MSVEALTLSLGAVSAAVWAVVLAVRVRVFHVILAYLLAMACFGPLFFRAGGLSLDWVVFGLLFGLYLWRRATHRIEPAPRDVVDYACLALLGWLGLRIVTVSISPLTGLENPLGRYENGYLLPLLLYWVTRNTFNPDQDAEPVLRLLVVFGAYLAFTGICEVLRLWPLVFPTYERDLALGIHAGRARGPFLQSHSMGVWLTVCLLAGHGLWPRLRGGARLWAGAAMAAMSVAIVLTKTRSVWLGAAAAALVLIWVAYRGAQRALILASLAVCGLLVFLAVGDEIISPTRKSGSMESQYSVTARKAVAAISWRMFRDKPLIGHGFGHYTHFMKDYYATPASVPLHWARHVVQHSTFLSLLVETGLIGLGLFLAVLAVWMAYAVHLHRHPDASPAQRALAVVCLGAVAVYAVQMTCVEITFSRFDPCLIGFVCGCVAAARVRPGGGPQSQQPPGQGETRDQPA